MESGGRNNQILDLFLNRIDWQFEDEIKELGMMTPR